MAKTFGITQPIIPFVLLPDWWPCSTTGAPYTRADWERDQKKKEDSPNGD